MFCFNRKIMFSLFQIQDPYLLRLQILRTTLELEIKVLSSTQGLKIKVLRKSLGFRISHSQVLKTKLPPLLLRIPVQKSLQISHQLYKLKILMKFLRTKNFQSCLLRLLVILMVSQARSLALKLALVLLILESRVIGEWPVKKLKSQVKMLRQMITLVDRCLFK